MAELLGTLLAVAIVVTALIIAGAPTWGWIGFGAVIYYVVGNS
jgi:hypothetical protein